MARRKGNNTGLWIGLVMLLAGGYYAYTSLTNVNNLITRNPNLVYLSYFIALFGVILLVKAGFRR